MLINTSDLIQIIGILCSLVTSIIAIAISVVTLKENSKMIEESSRPYIAIYGTSTYISSPDYYLVLKNYGKSSAMIETFTYDFDLKNCNYKDFSKEPFGEIEGTMIMPGQSFTALIDFNKTIEQTKSINFFIRYSSESKQYEQDFCVKLDGNFGNLVLHHTTKGKELSCISEVLQELNIRNL